MGRNQPTDLLYPCTKQKKLMLLKILCEPADHLWFEGWHISLGKASHTRVISDFFLSQNLCKLVRGWYVDGKCVAVVLRIGGG